MITDAQIRAWLDEIARTRTVVPGCMRDTEFLCDEALRGETWARVILTQMSERKKVAR